MSYSLLKNKLKDDVTVGKVCPSDQAVLLCVAQRRICFFSTRMFCQKKFSEKNEEKFWSVIDYVSVPLKMQLLISVCSNLCSFFIRLLD